MTGSQSFPPPPGWHPPPPPTPRPWGPPPGTPLPPPGQLPGQPAWATGMLGAAHKPGAMPLRPLGLGDVYDAAFRIIRFNPKATVGAAVLVAAAAMVLPVLGTAALAAALDLSTSGGDDLTGEDVASLATGLTLVVGGVLQYLGLIFVTGMVAHVTAAAAIGRRLSLGEAWAATRGRRWRLVGLTLLIGLIWIAELAAYVGLSAVVLLAASSWALTAVWFVVSGPAFLALAFWTWIRVTYLAVPAMMVERLGVGAAIGRGFRLTRKQFWRTLGIGLLTWLIGAVASQVLTVPFGIAGSIATVAAPDSDVAIVVVVVVNALGTVASTAFVAPFTAAVASLQYLDQRIRKEAYDVELMTQAGVTAR